jgi:hypothetical protein
MLKNLKAIETFGVTFCVYSFKLNVFQLTFLLSQFVLEHRSAPPGGSLIDYAVDFGATSNT